MQKFQHKKLESQDKQLHPHQSTDTQFNRLRQQLKFIQPSPLSAYRQRILASTLVKAGMSTTAFIIDTAN